MFKNAGWIFLAATLVSCGVPRPRAAAHQDGGELSRSPGLARAAAYRIDTAASELRVLVYRSGPMARFGHNHVMVNRSLAGTAQWAGAEGAASFSLVVPAAGFVVDDTQVRHDEGADFPGEISEDAKAGTLRNMLSAALLDASEFPDITVEGTRMAGDDDKLAANLVIHIAGHESTLEVPLTLQMEHGRLSAAGSLELRQTSLGLTPFSLMMGALQVQDVVRLKFKIVAVAG